MISDMNTDLAGLMPTERLFVMDLLEQVGIDVAPWRVTAEGRPVKKPRANPHYCYNWAFGSEAEGFLVCVWHASLRQIALANGPAIAFQDNVRDLALALDRIAIDRTQPTADRNRARDQAKRARAFDRVLQLSFRRGRPLRMIVNEGDRRDDSELGTTSSSVKLRKLDTENWYVHSYVDDTGDVLLVRGDPVGPGESVVLATVSVPESTLPAVFKTESDRVSDVSSELPSELDAKGFVDQFSAPVAAALREATVLLRDRSPIVRATVLRRAQGICELCGEPGFVTTAGSVYLETHHVVPLANDGQDHPSNVVAICPRDHRRAHFAAERDEIAVRLKEVFASVGAGLHRENYATQQ